MKHIKLLTVLLFVLLMATTVFAAEGDVFYIRDGGSGDGSTAAKAGASLDAAYYSLNDGGTIVVCGPYTVSSTFNKIAHSGKLTITSVYGGVDYRKTNNAAINIGAHMYLGGETEFCNIVLNGARSYPIIYAFNQPTVFGDGIVCGKTDAAYQYPCIVGGLYKAQSKQSSTLTINSGTWQRVRGGPGAGGSTNYTVNITINGGTFIERVILGSSQPDGGSGAHQGDINAVINGGEFRQGMVAASLAEGDILNSNVTVTINGGKFYGKVGVCATELGAYTGSFNLNFYGGDFAHIVELVGPAALAAPQNMPAMTSTLGGTYNVFADIEGTYTFTNPIRLDGADPWLFYHDGFYYYTSTTSSSSVKLTRAANFGDLILSNGKTIYTPEEGAAWAASTWSPTILHYTDEEVGAGNGGWYLYFGGEDETDVSDVNHRMYVLKCLDGDNLFGQWGNPITGEVNVPQRVTAPDIAGFDDTWAAGQGDIRINGKVYTIYVTEVNKHTQNYYQTINIIPMNTPWEFDGTSTVICTPTYDWETYGYGKIYDENGKWTGLWAPKVVEAATPVYGNDGSVFIVYSGSNYTSDYYCLGQLKFKGGDPMVASNWVKKSTPILSQGNGVTGTGSASYITDTAGQGWVCYNAYFADDESRVRYAMLEPYTASSSGIVIGNGSGKAASKDKVYTAALNSLPLAYRMSGFHTFYVHSEVVGTDVKLSFSPVEGASSYTIRRDGKLLGASTTFEFIDKNAPVGMHTYKVQAMNKGYALSTSIIRAANYQGLVYGDIDGDGDIDIVDALLLIKSVLNKSSEANLLDVMKLMKCIY